jgi:tripartite-type tricarboxylate transporter receptor subunit TctC
MKRPASASGNLMTTRRFLIRGVAALLLGVCVAPVAAQEAWPTQAIKIVVPYAAGGSADAFARQFGEQLARELGQVVVIDNRPGASTNIGAAAVVKARPDGYTLLLGSLQQVLSPVFGPDPGFELLTSFEAVSLMARLPFVVAAHPAMPFNDARALVAAAKTAPGTLSIASAQLDMFVELLNSKAGVKLLNVPYKGGAPATTDAISGQVNMVYAGVSVLLPHIQAGKLKALAVTTASRVASLPDVPTFVESGVDYDVVAWYGLARPGGHAQADRRTPGACDDVDHDAQRDGPEGSQQRAGAGNEPPPRGTAATDSQGPRFLAGGRQVHAEPGSEVTRTRASHAVPIDDHLLTTTSNELSGAVRQPQGESK